MTAGTTAGQVVAAPAVSPVSAPPVSEAVARRCLSGLMLALGADPDFVDDFTSAIDLQRFTDTAGSVDIERVARFSVRWARPGRGGAS